MGDLNYDGNAVLFESSIFPKKLKAEYIIADLQFAYYKSEALQQALSLLGLDFSSETLEDGTKVRLIKNKNNIIEEIKQNIKDLDTLDMDEATKSILNMKERLVSLR